MCIKLGFLKLKLVRNHRTKVKTTLNNQTKQWKCVKNGLDMLRAEFQILGGSQGRGDQENKASVLLAQP